MTTRFKQQALDYHASPKPGKIATEITKPCDTQLDLSLAYTPGVAEPCRAIYRDEEAAYDYTAKGNLVAVITDGTAVLGLGDIGALALGASLGVVAVAVRQEIAFFIMGGIFVIETASVILQVASFKLTGKRIFRMAPIHHHFELKGWAEPKVIVRFWIITVILVLIGLASLKIR